MQSCFDLGCSSGRGLRLALHSSKCAVGSEQVHLYKEAGASWWSLAVPFSQHHWHAAAKATPAPLGKATPVACSPGTPRERGETHSLRRGLRSTPAASQYVWEVTCLRIPPGIPSAHQRVRQVARSLQSLSVCLAIALTVSALSCCAPGLRGV